MEPMSRAVGRNMLVIFFVLTLDLIAFTMILPLFPSILDHYDALNKGSQEKDLWLDAIHGTMDWMKATFRMPESRRYNIVLVGGILGSLFSFLQFISSPCIGALSDIFGRKKVLLLTMIGTSISYFIWWNAGTFTIFLLSRIVGGLSKGSVTICTAMMADISSKENRGKAMALVGLAFSLGFIAGPLVGAYFASKAQSSDDVLLSEFSRPAQLALLIQVVSMVLLVGFGEETLAKSSSSSVSERLRKAIALVNPLVLLHVQRTSKVYKNASILQRLTLVNFLFLMLFAGLEFTLTFLTHERFNFTSMQQGRLFFFCGLVMMLVQGGYVRRLKHGKEKAVAMQGIVAVIPGMLLLSFASSVSVTCGGLLLYSFGAGAVFPCVTSLFSQEADEGDTGESLGMFRSAGALARALAPAITCSVYWSVGSRVCYFVGAVLFVIPLLLMHSVHPSKSADKKE